MPRSRWAPAAAGAAHRDPLSFAEVRMPMQSDGRRAGPLFKVLFYLIATLLIAAAAFTGWIVVLHWDRVGV